MGRRPLPTRWAAFHLVILLIIGSSCGRQESEQTPKRLPSASVTPVFTDVALQSGIDFQHVNGSTGRFYYPETYGSGVVFLDYDNDGDQDLYLVNSAALPGFIESFEPANALYENNDDGTFTDVTGRSGVGDQGYGLGVCAADYNNDGHVDLYVTNFGPNVLFRNEGNGTFTDVTDQAGVGDPRMSTSAAFADYDGDGYVDLYVANNAHVPMDSPKKCRHGVVPVYCGPGQYEGVSGSLYHNEGDGTFTDVTRQAGVYDESGRQLGAVFSDYDQDGDADLYIANDTKPNWLFRNDGETGFTEVGLTSGVAVNPEARPEAGMGTDWGDYDRDGLMDIIVCNFQWESCRLLANQGDGFFDDRTFLAGLGEPTYSTLTFGTDFLDYDNDGFLDIFIANGHVDPNIGIIDRGGPAYAQHDQLFHNNGDRTFDDVSEQAGLQRFRPRVGRGSATADYDNDGDLDLFISNNNQRPMLLRNDGGNSNNWLSIKTVGHRSNRDGIGALITVHAAGFVQSEEVRAGSSYLSQNDLRVHFGLGTLAVAETIEVRWPSGTLQTLQQIDANQFLVIEEPVD
ncbi:MAG: CRTAC1 family protein [Candidatus Latescibacterota bacterium]